MATATTSEDDSKPWVSEEEGLGKEQSWTIWLKAEANAERVPTWSPHCHCRRGGEREMKISNFPGEGGKGGGQVSVSYHSVMWQFRNQVDLGSSWVLPISGCAIWGKFTSSSCASFS